MEHIDAMEELKQGIGLVAYAQRDPLLVYKKEGFDMFDEMTEDIQKETIKVLCKSKFVRKEDDEEQKQAALEKKKAEQKQYKKSDVTVGRNDPCPCGSGKKYKNCCGRNL